MRGDSKTMIGKLILTHGGLARELVHYIQQERKNQGLDYADRIRVTFKADSEMKAAVDENKEWIQGETLAVSLEGEVHSGNELAIQLEKV